MTAALLGQKITGGAIRGVKFTKGAIRGVKFDAAPPGPAPTPYPYLERTIIRQLDRVFGITPTSGGGNVAPDTFLFEGGAGQANATWQLWQCIPFLGQGVVSGDRVGDARIHLRDTSIGRGQMQLSNMPDQIIIYRDGWTNTPWVFNRPTANNKFSNAGSGNNARKSIDYEPVRTPGANPAAEGISNVVSGDSGQVFAVTLRWNNPSAPALPATGVATRVGAYGMDLSTQGLAALNGMLYTVVYNGNALYRINPATGAIARVGALGGGVQFETALGVLGNTLYLATQSRNTTALYTVNPTTGRATRVAALTGGEIFPGDMTAIGDKLYMTGQSTDALYTVNTTTGALTQVGSATQFGLSLGAPNGLAARGDMLYMNDHNTRALYAVDPTTGIATRVGNAERFGVPLNGPSGMEFIDGTLYLIDTTTNALYTVA